MSDVAPDTSGREFKEAYEYPAISILAEPIVMIYSLSHMARLLALKYHKTRSLCFISFYKTI